MIGVLGAKRVFVIFLLVAINAALAVGVYLFLIPMQASKQGELSSLNSKVSTVQSDINRMQIEFDQLAEQEGRYEALKKRGFFNNQERRQAEKMFESIQNKAGVIAAGALIEPGVVEENEEAQKAEYKILMSPVKVHIEALDAVDVYRYVYMLERYFPGHLGIKEIAIQRKAEVTGTVLRGIASGSNPVLVEADINMVWRTMISQSQVIETQTQGGSQ